MKLTKQQFLDSTSINPKLINAVVNKGFGDWKLFKERAQDTAEHGCQSGIAIGFVYYTNTVAFAEKYVELIVKLIQDQAREYGNEDTVVSFINGCKTSWLFGVTTSDIEDCLILRNKDNDWYEQLFNWLCWYACEVVCQEYVYLCESGE